jgi:predicted AAA+ superfamily ATPase
MDYIRGKHREVLGSSVGVNMELTVFRDIPRYQQFDDRSDLQALCAIAAMNPGQTLGLKDLSEDLACDRRTLQRYIDILEDFFLLTPSYQYEYERRRSVRLYLRDPLLLGSLLDIELTGLLPTDAERRLTTVAVFDHLKRLGFSYLGRNAEVRFWESGGVGVDYVIETSDGIPIPFVTASASGERAPTDRIGTFCSEHDCEFGVRIGRDVDPSIEENVVTLPLWLFLLFI